jgi:hypothetical protein
MPFATTPYNKPLFKARVVVPATEAYADQLSYHDKLQAHARNMLSTTVGLVVPHINSPHSNFNILNEESAYLKAEIEKATKHTLACSDSHKFYESLEVPNPSDFHQKLCGSIYAAMRSAWADYSAKTLSVSGKGFDAYVSKRIDRYTPVMDVRVGKLNTPQVSQNVGPARLLPPVRPPGMRLQGRGKFAAVSKDRSEIAPIPAFKMVETDDFIESPSLKPLESSMPKLRPLSPKNIECHDSKKRVADLESSMPALKPLETKKPTSELKSSMPALKPFESSIKSEMPALEPLPIESDVPELEPFEQDEMIEGPKDWARKKKDQFADYRKDKAKEKLKLKEKKKELTEERREKSKERKEARMKSQLKSVTWLANHLEGAAGFEKLSLPANKSYIYMASSDQVVEQLVDRQKQRGGTLNTLLFVKSHLAEKPVHSMISASFTTFSGLTIQKDGSKIVKPELLNPAIISAEKITIGSNEFTILEHDNILPGKQK